MMGSGSVGTSTSSLSPLRWVPSGPMGLGVSLWCSRSLIISPWITGLYSAPCLCVPAQGLGPLGTTGLAIKD